MKDTRKQREMIVTLIATGGSAIVGAYFVGPWLAKKLNVKVRK